MNVSADRVTPLRRLIYNTAAFARQYPAGDGSVYYRCIKQPVNDWLLTHHLDGRDTLATYLVAADRRTRVGVIDFDTEQGRQQAVTVSDRLSRAGIPCLLEGSRNGRAHLWLLLDVAQDWRWLRRCCLGVLADTGLQAGIEVFPRSQEQYGSAVRLPLGVHRKGERPEWRRYPFLFPDGTPVGRDQPLEGAITLNLDYLAKARTASPERLDRFAALAPAEYTLDERRGHGEQTAASNDLYDAIGRRLGVQNYDDQGWSNRVACVVQKHEHDDRHPAARWNRRKHVYRCHKCNLTLLGDEIAAVLKLRREDFAA